MDPIIETLAVMIKSICRFYTKTFQKRYYDHRSSFTREIYRHRTSL